MTAPQFDYDRESQCAGLAGVDGSTRVFCDPPLALSRYRSEDRKDAGNTFGLTGMWPRSLWATSHIPRSGLPRTWPQISRFLNTRLRIASVSAGYLSRNFPTRVSSFCHNIPLYANLTYSVIGDNILRMRHRLVGFKCSSGRSSNKASRSVFAHLSWL
jgi:hypothetical protein